MKGIVIVSTTDLKNSPEVENLLSAYCERVESEASKTLFFAREGSLMTMICILLDKDVKYSLDLGEKSSSSRHPSNTFASN